MPVDVTDKYVRIRVRDPDDFQEGSFRTITLSAKQGIRAVIGRLKGEDTTEVQSYLFDKEKWNEKRAKAWVAMHEKEEQKAVDETQFLDIDGENVSIAGLVEAYKASLTLPDGPASMAIKALREEGGGVVVGGYLLLWGDPQHRDLGKDYFTKSTELWLDKYPTVPALFHHGLDQDVGLTVVGHRVKAAPDDTGVWVEDWLDKSSKFWSLVKPLLDAERLFYSPGSAPHLVRREPDGELKAFPVIEDTMTPIPMQHRLLLLPIEQVKAAYKSADLVLPPELLENDDGGGDAGASRQSELEALKAKIEIENFLLTLNYIMEA